MSNGFSKETLYQNGNLVTLKGEAYTPTGDIRVNFVDHGADLTQEGAQLFTVLAIGIISRVVAFQVATYKAGASHCCSSWVQVLIEFTTAMSLFKIATILPWLKPLTPYSTNILTPVLSLNLTKTATLLP
jgi:hypothetical protein